MILVLVLVEEKGRAVVPSLPTMWPELKSRRRRDMWVESVVGSLLCS